MKALKPDPKEINFSKLVQGPFPGKQIKHIKQFNSGDFNSVFLINFSDDTSCVLKLSAKDDSCRMKNEPDPMDNEVLALKEIQGKVPYELPVPDVKIYDDTKTMYSGKYFFSEVLPGKNYYHLICNEYADDKEKRNYLDYRVGKFAKHLREIEGKTFGFLADKNHQFDSLFNFTEYQLKNALSDAKEKNIVLPFDEKNLLELFNNDAKCFNAVEVPVFVHGDLDSENVFISDNDISAVMDWEKACYGDPLMEVCFRIQKCLPAFLDGYGQFGFNYYETRRLLWYDVIYYIGKMIQGAFRGYENDELKNKAEIILKQTMICIENKY